jgi:hypothetical protein
MVQTPLGCSPPSGINELFEGCFFLSLILIWFASVNSIAPFLSLLSSGKPRNSIASLHFGELDMSTPAERFCGLILNSRWTGKGRGFFPTMSDFEYGAHLNFAKPEEKTKRFFLKSSLESWPPGKRGQNGMHYEEGFIHVIGECELSWCIAHNFGITEVSKCVVDRDGLSAVCSSSHLGNASEVLATKRELRLRLNEGCAIQLHENFYMSTRSVEPLTHHLSAVYDRDK